MVTPPRRWENKVNADGSIVMDWWLGGAYGGGALGANTLR
jgi:hypothetical protein